MSKFKVGDKVICLHIGDNVHITEGSIYEVALDYGYDECRSRFLKIVADNGQVKGYLPDRFELYKEPVIQSYIHKLRKLSI